MSQSYDNPQEFYSNYINDNLYKKNQIPKNTSTKVGIGLPMLFPFIHMKFFDSYQMLRKPDNHVGISVIGSITSIARNNICEAAEQQGCTHIMFLDTDMTFPPDTIEKLLAHDKDIVGGLYFERYHPYKPAVFWKHPDGSGDYALPHHIPYGELMECDALATGCMLIKMDVFKKLSKPWFEYRVAEYGSKKEIKFYSEDIVFCERVKELGYKIFVDTSIECGHLLNDIEVTRQWWESQPKTDVIDR